MENEYNSVYDNIMTEVYNKSIPTGDWSILRKEHENSKKSWGANYYIPDDVLDAIVHKHIDNIAMTKRDRCALCMTVYLGDATPVSNKELWDKLTENSTH